MAIERFDVDRVRLRQYRSIKQCDVKLGSLTVLVGPNGSGKSNFVDSFPEQLDAVEHLIGRHRQLTGTIDRPNPRPAHRHPAATQGDRARLGAVPGRGALGVVLAPRPKFHETRDKPPEFSLRGTGVPAMRGTHPPWAGG